MREPPSKPEIQFVNLADVDLAGWLRIATANLEPSAQQRIAAEIQSHFTDSVAAHLADGQTECASQAAALSELGDPHTAAKRFKKSHLTNDDIKSIQVALDLAAKPLISWANLLMIAIPMFALHFLRRLDDQFFYKLALFSIAQWLLMAIGPQLFYKFSSITRNHPKPLVGMRVVSCAGLVSFALCANESDSHHGTRAFFGMACISVHHGFKFGRVFLKLHRTSLDGLNDPITPSKA